MDRFKELTTFVEVAQRGSLSAAAREEGITPAMVGRRIDQLEERLGVKLFKRSTRKVTLTPEGSTFYEDVHRLLDELRGAEESLSVGAKSASGRLIVTAPTAFGRKHIAPHLAAFIAEHPSLAITLHLSERMVDLKNERFDLAIRIADLKSADLIAAKLARNHRVVCGAPNYFKRAGRPKLLADLARHNCLVTSTEDGVADSWSFLDKGKPVSVKVGGSLQCNDGEVLTRWAIAGEGLAWRSAWEVSEEVKRGRLATVLDEFAFPGNNIYAVYPERRLLPAKVKLFIEFLRKTFGDPPYWE
ncbi:LysR family transcriptional regulator [Usitatibacter palustris]|uniref:HTH-type transcriptional regulator DmlR n=1 Tax=Usitatibacter palustris TaxID=2732487 RepID=A0A6M4HCQ5_9PROT|nr:LysR family transcriptional regulator [Usitatibacter palustris]QJR16855.1 HTH-type transcriptional regulator DmlR [Usitatibacter palustris]